MVQRAVSVDLFERDLRAFLPFMKLSQGKFCKAYKFNKNLLSILGGGGSVGHAVMNRAYEIMHEAGFVSLRQCADNVIAAALLADDEAMFEAAAHLRVYNKMYADAHDH